MRIPFDHRTPLSASLIKRKRDLKEAAGPMTTAQIEQSEVRDAAEAMLAALEAYREHRAKVFHAQMMGQPLPDGVGAILDNMDAAIAQAHASGIRVKD